MSDSSAAAHLLKALAKRVERLEKSNEVLTRALVIAKRERREQDEVIRHLLTNQRVCEANWDTAERIEGANRRAIEHLQGKVDQLKGEKETL